MEKSKLTDEQYFALEAIVYNFITTATVEEKEEYNTLLQNAVAGIKTIAEAKYIGTTAIDAAYEVYIKKHNNL